MLFNYVIYQTNYTYRLIPDNGNDNGAPIDHSKVKELETLTVHGPKDYNEADSFIVDPRYYNSEDDNEEINVSSMIDEFKAKGLEALTVHDPLRRPNPYFFTSDPCQIEFSRKLIAKLAQMHGSPIHSGFIIFRDLNGGIDGLDALSHLDILEFLHYCDMYRGWSYVKFSIDNQSVVVFCIETDH